IENCFLPASFAILFMYVPPAISIFTCIPSRILPIILNYRGNLQCLAWISRKPVLTGCMHIEIECRILPDFHHPVEHCQCLLILLFTCLLIVRHVLECAVAEVDACIISAVFRCRELECCSEVDPERILMCT